MVKKLRRRLRNNFEKRIERVLKRKKVSFKYESEKIPYVIAGHYIPDFIVETNLGKIYLETKGHFRPEAKRKMAAVKRQHPEMDIRILFYSHKIKDIKWCEKNHIKYAIDKIPDDWLEGL
ncbi:MAG: hypothetical protein ACREHG_09530 [Candidatus Saccharimonadales bacterium]